jgi:ubiquinone/menaquinone biosynthesis C-methylase UbiE
VVPDNHFADPRLAAIYDELDDDRSDLDHYVQLVVENGARSVLDVGCGTGSLACRLAELGLNVTGLDPAEASLDVARRKHLADTVRWIHGTTAQLPKLTVDLAIMTGNVAQVFLSDEDWAETLAHIRSVLRPDGLFIFETRIPSRRGWEEWTPDLTRRTTNIPNVGSVEYSVRLLDVSLPFVSFRSTYRFANDNTVLTSDSTLRFRELPELNESLELSGFHIQEVRDAPDRPGREYVIIAQTTP